LEKKSVAFGADEPNSSEPAGLKEGVFQMPGGGCVCWEEEDGCREGGGKWLVCISVLHVCFLVSVLIVKGGNRCTLVVSSVKSRCDSHIWFRHLGWADCGLLVQVTAFVKMSTRAVIDPRDARLAVRLYTTDGAPADCMEPNPQNQGGPKSQCGHYSGKRRIRGQHGVV